MMILIMVLVGLTVGGIWWYTARPVARRAGIPLHLGRSVPQAGEQMNDADDPVTRPNAEHGAVDQARSCEPDLRDSLLATEVVEVGFDDQLASDLEEGEVERALFLLRQLVQARPRDTGHRMRLLSLLYSERRLDDFVREAMDAKRLVPPIDARAWLQVCDWGSTLDPANKLFIPPAPRAAGAHPSASAEQTTNPSPASNPGARKDTSDDQWNGRERRKGKDRRISNSPWLGEERRKSDRRSKVHPINTIVSKHTVSVGKDPASAREQPDLAKQSQDKCANA